MSTRYLEDYLGEGFYGNAIGSKQKIDFSLSPQVLLPSGAIATVGDATLIVAASNSLNPGQANYTCTGINDQNTINTAIAALPTNGGRIVLLEGTYNLGGSINIAGNNITIEGQGKGTQIKLANSISTSMIALGSNTTQYYRAVIKGIYFDGNWSNQTGFNRIIDNFNQSFNMAELLITECYFINAQFAISTGLNAAGIGLMGTTVTNCQFENWSGQHIGGLYVLDLEDYPNGAIVQNCNFIGNSVNGTIISDGNINSTVIGCNITLPSGYNDTAIVDINIMEASVINVTSPGASCILLNLPITVIGNLFNFNGSINIGSTAIITGTGTCNIQGNFIQSAGIGIQLLGTGGIISSNIFTTILTNAIKINNSSKNSISNNIFQNCANQTNNTYDVISIIGSSDHNIINSNQFFSTATNKPRYNINENNAGNSDVFTSNIALNAATAQLNITGGSSIQANNIVT